MSMSLDAGICAYFVNNIKRSNESSNAAQQFANSVTLMRNHIADTQIRQIKPSEGYALIAAGGLTKKDVFVLALFEGDFFEQLQLTKALIVGPPCLVTCLMKCTPIPLGNSPVYTTAMRDLQISATGITVKEKDHLSKLIQWMGGHYFQNFGRTITHLISNTIKSNKYEHATLNGVPVMHVDWVERVWERSTADNNICATDVEFDKYRLPTFFGANITCSGLDSTRKDAIMRLVNENGGNYHRAFRSQLVDIVITDQSSTDSDKYKAAVRFKKDVLLPEWIFDSHERGFALPTKKYEVHPRKQVSTPTKKNVGTGGSNQTMVDPLSDLSRISFVSGGARRMCSDITTVNETITSLNSSVISVNAAPVPTSSKELLRQATTKPTSSMEHYQQALTEICPREAKKAGTFLDGCCVFLSGFRAEEREKLNRVLNTGGATRYDEANEGVTHIIVGQLEDSAYRQWQSNSRMGAVHIVRLEWLLESIKAGRIVSELVYRVSLPHQREPDVASPASKRTLRSMNHSFKQPDLPIKKKLFVTPGSSKTPDDDEPDEHLLTQYSQEHEPAATLPPINDTHDVTMQPAASSTQLGNIQAVRTAAKPQPQPDLSASAMSIDFEKLDYFMGASVYVHKESFSSEFYTQMLSECEAAQGNLVPQSFSDPVDYAIVSFEVPFDKSTLPVQARYIVTELYLESCMKQNKLLPLDYYHHPIPCAVSSEPLQGMTVVVSLYSGLERDYINSVAELLGATVNKTFIKKEKPLLVCSNAEGSKYDGAIKWGYPVVTSAWLVECANHGQKLPYRDFLVGNSVPDFPISPRLKTPATPSIRSDDIENNATALATPLPQRHATPEVTPLRNKRVSELALGTVTRNSRRSAEGVEHTAPDSPHTPLSQVGAAGYNFDFLDQFVQRLESDAARDCLRDIIREMRENQTPELERIRRQACTPVNRRAQRPTPGIPNFCLTPEFQQRMADDFERRWRLPTRKLKPDTPIADIRQRVMRITCETLGIPYAGDEEDSLQATTPRTKAATPTPSSGKANASRTLFEKPSTPVTPAEPHVSHFVPNTQSPNMDAASADSANAELVGRSTINFDKISFEETTNMTTEAAAPLSSSSATIIGAAAGGSSSSASNSPELKQITDYLKDCASRRNSLKRNHSRSERALRSAPGDDCYMESEVQYVQPFESEGFTQGTDDMVDWRDPADFNANKRRTTNTSRMQHIGTPRFSISCSGDDTRQSLIDKIHKLGGEMCENLVNFDAGCTHFLCERPNRGEKTLGCIASGKWILHINYIEECNSRGVFVDEQLFEWGNAKAVNLPGLPAEEQLIAVAAHRWRLQLRAGQGAFSAFRVILSLQERNVEAIKNVLRAGGADILEPRSPYSSDETAATATHCFVDPKKAPLAPRDFAYLQQRGVQILSQMYINAYLMAGSEANLEKYLLQK